MTVDYYALLTKAVTGKDTLGRDKVYKDAYDLITKSHLNREVAASHVAALEAAIRRIEDDIAVEEGRDAAQINEVLSDGHELEAMGVRRRRARTRHRPVGCGLWICHHRPKAPPSSPPA